MRPDPGTAGARGGRVRRMVRRPALVVALLAVAVGVSVAEGQPPPAARDSGVSVNATESYRGAVGTLLVVADGRLIRVDTVTGRDRSVPLPRGLAALRVWTLPAGDVVLGRLASGRTAAYLLAPGRPPAALGPAEVVVPSADRTAVWLSVRRTATRVPLGRGARRSVPLPRATRLVGDTAAGLIVSSGTVPDPPLPGRRPKPTPTLTPSGSSGLPSPTLPGGSTPAPPAPPTAAPTVPPTTPPPATPPYTTASPMPSTGPEAVPLTTLVVSATGAVRFLAAAEALAAGGDVVLVRDGGRRLGVISPRPGRRQPRWLPNLSAVQVIGPGSLDAGADTFAVLARVNDYARLMVGPVTARTEAAINVVALDGGPPRPDAAAPAFTASGRVLVVRPDGRVVYYTPGERTGFVLGQDLPPAAAVTQA